MQFTKLILFILAPSIIACAVLVPYIFYKRRRGNK